MKLRLITLPILLVAVVITLSLSISQNSEVYASVETTNIVPLRNANNLTPNQRLSLPVPGQNSAVVKTGTLRVLIGDPLPEYRKRIGTQYVYLLEEVNGDITQLDLDREMLSDPLLQRLDGNNIEVLGYSVSADQNFLASEISSLPESEEDQLKTDVSSQSVLNLLCKFPDKQENLEPLSYFTAMFGSQYPGLNHYWQELSYDALSVEPVHVKDWHTLPGELSTYMETEDMPYLGQLYDDCRNTMDSSIDVESYDLINLYFNESFGCCAWGGGGKTWLPPWAYYNIKYISHEMGHAIGLPHSGGAQGPYDNPWDVMSGTTCNLVSDEYGCLGQHTISYHKDRLGWLQDSEIYILPPDSTSTISLKQLALTGNGDGYLMAKVPISSSGNYYYTVEARNLTGYDAALLDSGIVIHLIDENRYIENPVGGLDWVPALVIDGDNNGDSWDEGTVWKVGETFQDDEFGIEITVDQELDSGYQVTITRGPQIAYSCDNNFDVPATECEALEAVFNSMGGENWTNNEGWGEWLDVCNWSSVDCYDGHVTTLDLQNNNLVGSIPPQISNLQNLRVLDLAGNQLTGLIPTNLGQLSQLQYLMLRGNHLSGQIPPSIGELSNLWYLDLGSNQIIGPLPDSVGELMNVSWLMLRGNNLIGPLPVSLANLVGVEYFSFSGTYLCVPDDPEVETWIGNIPNKYGIETACNQLAPTAVVNYNDGAPGSYFLVFGYGFDAG
ncbi:MAG: leucine-rich repeat domain-containing protein [Anaerolineales bacterium]|jgi:hypothetical protein